MMERDSSGGKIEGRGRILCHDPRRSPLRRHLRRTRGQPAPPASRSSPPCAKPASTSTPIDVTDDLARRHRRADAEARRRVQRAARPLRRGRRDPGRARLARHSLHPFRRARLGARDGQGRGQGGVRRRRPAGRARPRRADATNSRPPIRCRCPMSSSRSTKARRSASRSSAAATTAAPRSPAPGASAAPRWSRSTSPAAN